MINKVEGKREGLKRKKTRLQWERRQEKEQNEEENESWINLQQNFTDDDLRQLLINSDTVIHNPDGGCMTCGDGIYGVWWARYYGVSCGIRHISCLQPSSEDSVEMSKKKSEKLEKILNSEMYEKSSENYLQKINETKTKTKKMTRQQLLETVGKHNIGNYVLAPSFWHKISISSMKYKALKSTFGILTCRQLWHHIPITDWGYAIRKYCSSQGHALCDSLMYYRGGDVPYSVVVDNVNEHPSGLPITLFPTRFKSLAWIERIKDDKKMALSDIGIPLLTALSASLSVREQHYNGSWDQVIHNLAGNTSVMNYAITGLLLCGDDRNAAAVDELVAGNLHVYNKFGEVFEHSNDYFVSFLINAVVPNLDEDVGIAEAV